MNVELLKAIRKLEGLTQGEFAKRLGVSRQLISMVEIDYTPISDHLNKRIYEEFGTEQIEVIKNLTGVLKVMREVGKAGRDDKVKSSE